MDLKGKTCLVTGSSSGIGQAIAIECAKAGANILIHYRKNEFGAKETLQQVKQLSIGKIFQADLSSNEEVKSLFQKFKESKSSVDLLVNCAGEYKSGELNDYELWNNEFNNIFFSMVRVTNNFINHKPTANFRKIVNISSAYGLLDMTFEEGMQYSAAKSAVNSLTVSLAKKYAPQILVNAVAPGYTWTPNWEGTSPEDQKVFENLARIKRYIQPEEIAQMVVQLFENDAITGEIIRVDGGLHLWEIK